MPSPCGAFGWARPETQWGRFATWTGRSFQDLIDRELGTNWGGSYSPPPRATGSTAAVVTATGGASTVAPGISGAGSCRCGAGTGDGAAGAAATWTMMEARRSKDPAARIASPARIRLDKVNPPEHPLP